MWPQFVQLETEDYTPFLQVSWVNSARASSRLPKIGQLLFMAQAVISILSVPATMVARISDFSLLCGVPGKGVGGDQDPLSVKYR